MCIRDRFRVTRNSELIVDEEDVDNLALALRDELLGRGYLRAVRLEIAEQCPQDIVDSLLANFELPANAVYKINGPVNLNRVVQVYDLVRRPDLKFPAFQPRLLRDVDAMFEQIRQGDVLLHHPYDAFAPVLELIRQAAEDPSVLAIKQTLYRAGKDSPIVEHLIQAARNGKDVTVVVELRARFDEEANLGLADRLQDAGVQVVYGVVGYKTHAKMLLIVRREGRELRRYVHLGTGNYHSGTARAYTDFSLMTANPEIGNDVHLIFQQLSGLAAPLTLRHLLQSPFTLHKGVLDRIARETAHARDGRPGRIVAKMNALNEPQVMLALYEASQAGVKVDLVVRGACTLRVGIETLGAGPTLQAAHSLPQTTKGRGQRLLPGDRIRAVHERGEGDHGFFRRQFLLHALVPQHVETLRQQQLGRQQRVVEQVDGHCRIRLGHEPLDRDVGIDDELHFASLSRDWRTSTSAGVCLRPALIARLMAASRLNSALGSCAGWLSASRTISRSSADMERPCRAARSRRLCLSDSSRARRMMFATVCPNSIERYQ